MTSSPQPAVRALLGFCILALAPSLGLAQDEPDWALARIDEVVRLHTLDDAHEGRVVARDWSSISLQGVDGSELTLDREDVFFIEAVGAPPVEQRDLLLAEARLRAMESERERERDTRRSAALALDEDDDPILGDPQPTERQRRIQALLEETTDRYDLPRSSGLVRVGMMQPSWREQAQGGGIMMAVGGGLIGVPVVVLFMQQAFVRPLQELGSSYTGRSYAGGVNPVAFAPMGVGLALFVAGAGVALDASERRNSRRMAFTGNGFSGRF